MFQSLSPFYIFPWKSWTSFSRLLLYLNPHTILLHAACFAGLTALLVSLHVEFFISLSFNLLSSSFLFSEYLSLSLHCIVDFSIPPPRLIRYIKTKRHYAEAAAIIISIIYIL